MMAQYFLFPVVAVVALLSTLALSQHHNGGGYHFASFSGPVSGQVKEIAVPKTHHQSAPNHYQQPQHAAPVHHRQYQAAAPAPAHHYGGNSVDYVAKPDYSFAYGVEDPHTGNTQNHKESRDGDVVKGQYSVLDPDGSMRTVTYTADSKNGFQATVHQTAPSGHAPAVHHHSPSSHHGGQQNNKNNNNDYNNYNHGQDYY